MAHFNGNRTFQYTENEKFLLKISQIPETKYFVTNGTS